MSVAAWFLLVRSLRILLVALLRRMLLLDTLELVMKLVVAINFFLHSPVLCWVGRSRVDASYLRSELSAPISIHHIFHPIFNGGSLVMENDGVGSACGIDLFPERNLLPVLFYTIRGIGPTLL